MNKSSRNIEFNSNLGETYVCYSSSKVVIETPYNHYIYILITGYGADERAYTVSLVTTLSDFILPIKTSNYVSINVAHDQDTKMSTITVAAKVRTNIFIKKLMVS